MLLIKEEKERLQNYLTSLKGFVFENNLPEDKISALKQEINRVESALLDVKIEPLYEIVTREGEFIQRVANAFNLEQITGTKRNDILSRQNQINYRNSIRKNKRQLPENVFSVRNHYTNERVYIRYLKTE